MSNIIVPKATHIVDKPSIDWRNSTILFPFQASGHHVVIRFTRSQYLRFLSECEELWARIRRRDGVDETIMDIDRHDRLV